MGTISDKLAYSITETAAVLGISRPTVYKLIHTEGFPVFRLGGRTLISSAGLDEWIRARIGGGVQP